MIAYNVFLSSVLFLAALTSSTLARPKKIVPCREIKNYDFKIMGVNAYPLSSEGVEMFLDKAHKSINYSKFYVQSDDHQGKGRKVNFNLYESEQLKAINLGSDVSDTIDGRWFVMLMQTYTDRGSVDRYFYVEDNGAQCETTFLEGHKPYSYRIKELGLDIQ